METLGKRMRKLRKKNYYTQADVAKALGVSPSAIGMYEQDRRVPDKETLLKICDFFDVSADYLLGHTSKPAEVSDVLDEFNKKLEEYDALMFDGNPLTDEERQQVFNTIDYVARLAERLSYENYEE